ncbi:hypothetical protein BV898_01137 [Hypsibius exemplaris]|uniref:ZP domain-containing protein n=1 Tax=Hypsibius exemplaris TaxID=2072580 RepID=A0A1W0XBN7_HYPEX|nr:hypothetical protein BV898_01137 [Hypsibius exemplaris]
MFQMTSVLAVAVMVVSLVVCGTSSGNSPGIPTDPQPRSPGMLICDGAQAEYRVQDSHVYHMAFPTITDAAILARARVVSVQIGSDPNNPACQAHRYPPQAPVSFQNSFTIIAPYNQCGFIERVNPLTHEISYTGQASILVHYPHPPGMPHIFRPKTIRMDLVCRTEGVSRSAASNPQGNWSYGMRDVA